MKVFLCITLLAALTISVGASPLPGNSQQVPEYEYSSHHESTLEPPPTSTSTITTSASTTAETTPDSAVNSTTLSPPKKLQISGELTVQRPSLLGALRPLVEVALQKSLSGIGRGHAIWSFRAPLAKVNVTTTSG